MRGTLRRLEVLLADKSRQLQEASAANEALRVRWAVLSLAVRLLRDIQRTQQRLRQGARGGGDGDDHLMRLQAMLSRPSAPGAADAQARPAAPAPQAAPPCGAALPAWLQPGAVAGPAGTARPGSTNGGGNGSSGGIGGDSGARLLEGVPHLAPDVPDLLRLNGTTPAEAEVAAALTLPELKARWAALVGEGLLLVPSSSLGPNPNGCPGPGAEEALHALGLRMERLLALVAMFNMDTFLAFMGSRTDADQGLYRAAGPGCEPGEAHWDRVARAMGISRLQALLIVGLNDAYLARITPLQAEQRRLAAELEALDAAAAAAAAAASASAAAASASTAPSGPSAAASSRAIGGAGLHSGGGRGGPGGGFPHGDRGSEARGDLDLDLGVDLGERGLAQAAILDDMEDLGRGQRALLLLSSQGMRVILTPAQFAKVFCLSWPHPVHQTAAVEVIRRLLAQEPGVFDASP